MKRAAALISTVVLLSVVSTGFAFAQQPDLGTDAQREAGKHTYDAKCAEEDVPPWVPIDKSDNELSSGAKDLSRHRHLSTRTV